MNKKFFLSVFLLGALTLSSGVLTSCIDNDEPEGITTLRGAKAELLRAKAALELAKAETEKQQALLIAAKAEVEKANAEKVKAEAEKVKAEAEYEKAKAAVEAAKVAQEEAKAEQEKAIAQQQLAIAEKELAAAEQAKVQAEAKIAEINAELEVTLLGIQKEVAEAQAALIEAEAALKVAQVTMTDAEKDKLDQLYNAVYATGGTLDQLKAAQDDLFDAQKALMEAEYTQEKYFAGLEEAVTEAKGTLAGVQAALESITKLEEATTIQDVETEKNELVKYFGENYTGTGYPTEGIAGAEIADINLAQERELISSDAQCIYDDAVATYQWVTTQQKFTLNKYELKIANETVKGKFETAYNGITPALPALLYTLNKATNQTYTQTINHNNKKIAQGWQAAIKKVSMTAEEVQDAQCAIDGLKEAAADADTAHMEAVAAWEAAHKQFEDGVPTSEVDQSKFKAVVAAFNAKFAALEAAVTAYNTKHDEVANAAADAYIAAIKAERAFDKYSAAARDWSILNAVGISSMSGTYFTSVLNCSNINQINSIIDIYVTDATKKNNLINKCNAASAWNPLASEEKEIKENAAKVGLNGISNPTLEQYSYQGGTYYLSADAQTAINKQSVNNQLSDNTTALATAKKAANDAAAYLNLYDKDDSYRAVVKAIGTENTTGSIEYTNATGYYKELEAKSHKFTLDATTDPTLAAAKDALTGINAGYAVVGGQVGKAADLTPAGEYTWIAPAVKSNEGNPAVYVADGMKLAVVRTSISDAAFATFAAPKFDPTLAEQVWKLASKNAFGANFDSRHAEIPASAVDADGKVGGVIVGGTLAGMIAANQAVADKQEILDAQADIAVVKANIDSIAKLVVAEVQVAIDAEKAAKKDMNDAALNVWVLTSKYQAQKDSIKHIAEHKYDLANAIDGVIAAYYGNTVFYYIDEEGEVVKFAPVPGTYENNFEGVTDWITAQKKIYTKNDPSYSGTGTSKGKVADAEKALADAEDKLEHALEANYGSAATVNDYFELYQIEIDRAQAEVERVTLLHNAALAQLNAFIEAMSK